MVRHQPRLVRRAVATLSLELAPLLWVGKLLMKGDRTCSTPSGPILATLLCLEDGAYDGEENMRRDLALLGSATGLLARPQLRFYQWSQPTATFGCFQTAADAVAAFPGLPVVQRPTGGGVLRHGFGHDLTYSLVVPYPSGYPKSGPLPGNHFLRLGVGASYCAIHRALGAALKAVADLDTRLAKEKEGAGPGVRPGACFSAEPEACPTPGDLLLEETGQKLAGAAQKRTKRGLLQQGSLVLPEGLDPVSLEPLIAKAFARSLAGNVAYSRMES